MNVYVGKFLALLLGHLNSSPLLLRCQFRQHIGNVSADTNSLVSVFLHTENWPFWLPYIQEQRLNKETPLLYKQLAQLLEGTDIVYPAPSSKIASLSWAELLIK